MNWCCETGSIIVSGNVIVIHGGNGERIQPPRPTNDGCFVIQAWSAEVVRPLHVKRSTIIYSNSGPVCVLWPVAVV